MLKNRCLAIILLLLYPFAGFATRDSLFVSIHEALASPEKVEVLDLRKQGIQIIDERIFFLPNLKKLYLQQNKISKIPFSIQSAKKLQVLDLSRNYIYEIPEEVGLLSELRSLSLHSNPLKQLPTSLASLANLKELILWGTDITFFPQEMRVLGYSLEMIDLRAINITKQQQKEIRALFPIAKIRMNKACNCGQ